MAKVSYAFRVPYRAGMEAEPGFVAKEEKTFDSYPGEKEFAHFKREKELVRADFKETDEQLIAKGMAVLGQNSARSTDMAAIAKQYGFSLPGGVGGINKTDVVILSAFLELTQDFKAIQKAVARHEKASAYLKGLSLEDLKPILEEVKAKMA